jgi:hypothetical protein
MIAMRVVSSKYGEVAERLNALASKANVPERVSGVRISPSPPSFIINNLHTLIPRHDPQNPSLPSTVRASRITAVLTVVSRRH